MKTGSDKFAFAKSQLQTRWCPSKESSRAILEMGNVGLIELKKPSIQCPSCLHHVFERTLVCRCGKLLRPNRVAVKLDRRSLRNLKAPYYCTVIVTRGSRCGPGPVTATSPQGSRRIAKVLQKVEGRTFTSIWDRWQHDEISGKLSFLREEHA